MQSTLDTTYNVVIADDDQDYHLLIKMALNETPYHINISSVYNGLELVDLLFGEKKHPVIITAPDLVILDLNMPRQNGFDVLKTIKKKDAQARLPVYVLSCSSNKEDINRSMTLGARGFFTKPSSYTALNTIVSAICKQVFK